MRETIDTMTGQMRKLRYEEFLSSEEEDDENDKDDEDLVTNKIDQPPGILILNKVDLMDRSKLSEQLPKLIQSLDGSQENVLQSLPSLRVTLHRDRGVI